MKFVEIDFGIDRELHALRLTEARSGARVCDPQHAKPTA